MLRRYSGSVLRVLPVRCRNFPPGSLGSPDVVLESARDAQGAVRVGNGFGQQLDLCGSLLRDRVASHCGHGLSWSC